VPPPSRTVTALRSCGQHVAAYSGAVDLVVEVAEFFVPAGDVFAACFRCVPIGLRVGAGLDQPCLFVGRIVRLDDRLLVKAAALHAAAPAAGVRP